MRSRNCLYLACTAIFVCRFKDKYFDPCLASKLESRLEVWPGFATAVNALEDGVFLQLDVSYKVLQNSTVLDQVKKNCATYYTHKSDLYLEEMEVKYKSTKVVYIFFHR